MASRVLMGICLAQELLALRLALEEGCGPGPGPPRELSFTKSSQAVRAVRDVLAVACANQWEQLRGPGGNEDGPQKLDSEGGHRPTPPMTHPLPASRTGPQAWCPSRSGGGKLCLAQGGAQIPPVTRAATLWGSISPLDLG